MSNKKGMEMWQLIFLVLALLLFFFLLFWYSDLGKSLLGLLGKLGEIF